MADITNHGPGPGPGPGRMLARGIVKHCPRCGQGHLFRRWFRMIDKCPRCDYLYDREEGFWLGAFVVNFAVAEGSLGILIVAFIIKEAAAQDTGGVAIAPWVIAGVVLAIVNPLLFYPFSKTIWTAIDLILHAGRTSVDRREHGTSHG